MLDARRPAGGRGQGDQPALGRAEAAHRHRPLHGAGARRAAARRAARRARPEAARADEDRAEAAAAPVRDDVPLHHPRPVRGAGDVGPRRGDERRPVRAGRHAAGALPRSRASAFVAGFVGDSNRWRGRVVAADGGAGAGRRSATARDGRRRLRARRALGAGRRGRGLRAAGGDRHRSAGAAAEARNRLPARSTACSSTAPTAGCWCAPAGELVEVDVPHAAPARRVGRARR